MLVRTAPMTGPSVEEVKARLYSSANQGAIGTSVAQVLWADSVKLLRDALAVIELLQSGIEMNTKAFDVAPARALLTQRDTEIASLRARLSRVEVAARRMSDYLRASGSHWRQPYQAFCYDVADILDQALTEGEAK